MLCYGHTNNITKESAQDLSSCIDQSIFIEMNVNRLVFVRCLVQNTGEADAGVRDSAFESLGMLWKCLGEKHILPNITDLDELKLTKVMSKLSMKEDVPLCAVLDQRIC